jgi:hypothetical protein
MHAVQGKARCVSLGQLCCAAADKAAEMWVNSCYCSSTKRCSHVFDDWHRQRLVSDGTTSRQDRVNTASP